MADISVEQLLKEWCNNNLKNDALVPEEVFDKHPLSAMILNSEESIKKDNLILILNTWKSEWHKDGVQVPVKSVNELPKPSFKNIESTNLKRRSVRFCLPEKLRRESNDDYFNENIHCIVERKNKTAPFYHIDDLDSAWMSTVNEERDCLGQALIEDWMLEHVIGTLEYLTFAKMNDKIKEIEVQALEFDENARCDICLSFEGEDGNELVFCDGCLLCVHQACYGIVHIPDGSWMCRQCEAGIKTTTPCSLCPNTGGAMKLSDDGKRWCHVSCALWVPEVGFGSIELMEPIIRLDSIPQARRNLLCSICRSRYGAPIQCSNKKCKTAFHVTCAFQSNLVMRQELVDKDVKLVGLCSKHSHNEKNSSGYSPDRSHTRTPLSPSKLMQDQGQNCNNMQQTTATTRKQRLIELEANFYNLIDDNYLNIWMNCDQTKNAIFHSISISQIPVDIRSSIHVYWRLKRRANFNQPLIFPIPLCWRESAEATTKDALAQAERAANEMEAFEAFRRVRFGLDRARLVVDMVLQRERRKLALFKRMWRISELQLSILRENNQNLINNEFIHKAHIGDSIYDNWKMSNNHSNSSHTTDQNISRESLKNRTQVEVQDSNLSNKKSSIQKPILRNSTKNNAVLVSSENLIVSDTMKHHLRNAWASVTNKYNNFWDHSVNIPNVNKNKVKSNLTDVPPNVTPLSSSNPQMFQTQTSPASSTSSSIENKSDRKQSSFPSPSTHLVQVKLSPLLIRDPLKYCNGFDNRLTMKKHRRRLFSHDTNSLENMNSEQEDQVPILSKISLVNLSKLDEFT